MVGVRLTTIAQFQRSGENEHSIRLHSQVGQVIGNQAGLAVQRPSPQSLT
jgi:hypothetical protein